MSDTFIDRLNEYSLRRWRELYDACAVRALQEPGHATWLDWFLGAARDAGLPAPIGIPDDRWFRALGVAMLEALPLPPEFRARRAARPGRNAECPCGSGRKYKQCCADYAKDVDLHEYDALEHVLNALPTAQYSALVRSQVDTRELAQVAGYWLEEGGHERVIALLAPWFAPHTGKFSHGTAPLLMCYIDALLAAERSADADAVVALALERGDRLLRGAAMRARAYARLDADDIDGAWEDFAEVRRLAPSDPDNATLELTILIDSERYADAQARARFWLPRLERNADRAADAPLEFVRRVIEDPQTALDQETSAREQYPAIAALEALLKVAPPLAPPPVATCTADGELVLARDADLRRLETRWADVFPVRKPTGIDRLAVHEDVLDDPDAWLEFLRAEPAAWQSLEVLDDLVLALADLLGESTLDPLYDALLERGAALALAQLAPDGKVAGRLAWDLRENRPPLRLLSFWAARLAFGPQSPFERPEFFAVAEQLLAVDPGDHYGVGVLLAQAYLMRGDPARALACGEPRVDDPVASLNHVLALYLVGRRDEARAAVAAVAGNHGDWLEMLRNEVAPLPPFATPSLDEDGYEDEEEDEEIAEVAERVLAAWVYREHMRALWQDSGGLAWLEQALR